jgi:hypothetical protein
MTISTGQFGGVYWNGSDDTPSEKKQPRSEFDSDAFSRIRKEEEHKLGKEFPELRSHLRSAEVMGGNSKWGDGGPDSRVRVSSRSADVQDLLHDAIHSRESEWFKPVAAHPTTAANSGGEVRAMGHPEGQEQWLQGMLFHPLTATGIPGDPLLKPGERAKDVENAFGFEVPPVENSGIPRTLLGTTSTNPKTISLDRRSKNVGAAYDPRLNQIHVRDESDPQFSGEGIVHELGHARDKDRLLENLPTKNMPYSPVAEGAADAFKDRFAPENIMAHESKFDPLLNPGRVDEIMKEQITRSNGQTRLRGYGGNSPVWKTRMEQASYALNRMRGALNPTGTARYDRLSNKDPYTASRLLSEVQQTPAQIEKPVLYNSVSGSWKTGGGVVHSQTLDVGRQYKNNPRARALLDQAGLSDAGQFASVVHDLHVQGIKRKAWQARDVGRFMGNVVDQITDPEARSEQAKVVMDDPNLDIRTKRTFLQPSLFDGNKDWDPEPYYEGPEEMAEPEHKKAWMKDMGVKKPGRRGPSEWNEIKKQHKENPFSLFNL